MSTARTGCRRRGTLAGDVLAARASAATRLPRPVDVERNAVREWVDHENGADHVEGGQGGEWKYRAVDRIPVPLHQPAQGSAAACEGRGAGMRRLLRRARRLGGASHHQEETWVEIAASAVTSTRGSAGFPLLSA